MPRTTRPFSLRFGLNPIKQKLRESSVEKIQQRRQILTQGLEDASLSWWEWAVLTGQLREINAAQHWIEAILAAPHIPPTIASEPFLEQDPIKSIVLDRLVEKLSLPLTNQTSTPLEIDILKPTKKPIGSRGYYVPRRSQSRCSF